MPDPALGCIVEEPVEASDALFTGVRRVLLGDDTAHETSVNDVVSKGSVACVGACESALAVATAAGVEPVALRDGHLTRSLTGVAGTLGLNAIDAEAVTDNWPNPQRFTRAVDGLQLDTKKLRASARYGVTKAISAPTPPCTTRSTPTCAAKTRTTRQRLASCGASCSTPPGRTRPPTRTPFPRWHT